MKKTAIIIGAGPAGLTAAYELLKRTDIKPVILEETDAIGGISRTVEYKGNRIDIGGHRFFSKSKKVMDWWTDILNVQGKPSYDEIRLGQDTKLKYQKTVNGPDPEKTDKVMLLRRRISRIFYLRSFFNYPVSLNINTFLNLGILRITAIGISYIWTRAFPIKKEKSLEDFFINRFGRRLYRTFFKDYTEKVWGVPCKIIKPEWGAQRIKGLSITKTLIHALKKPFIKKDKGIYQKKTETSLIEQFMYPKLGPGQLWESVAEDILRMGGEIHKGHKVVKLRNGKSDISSVLADSDKGTKEFRGDFFISTMPVKDLFNSFEHKTDGETMRIANGLMYRDFITVGLLLKKTRLVNRTNIKTVNNIVPDNWIYIQERDVKIGRLQVFNNWSPYLVKDPDTVWLGLEYFCNEGDPLWTMKDRDFIEFAAGELEKIGIIDIKDVIDSVLIRMPKTYPAYFGTYDEFSALKDYVSVYENLYLIGRNGMHRYNNMDHSMMTAMVAVENIASGIKDKENIWAVNTEDEYHETEEK